jgi:hypothetical protein
MSFSASPSKNTQENKLPSAVWAQKISYVAKTLWPKTYNSNVVQL